MTQNPQIDVTPMQPNQAGICRRRAVAMARSMPRENEPKPPQDDAENRRRAAVRLAPLALERMQEDGWVIDENVAEHIRQLAPGMPVRIPPHRTMHRPEPPPDPPAADDAEIPEPQRFDVLVRVPGPGRRVTVNTRGAANAYYDDIAAVAAAQESPLDVIVAVYDSDSGEFALHRVTQNSLEEMKAEWLGAMRTLRAEADEDSQLPPPEHTYDAVPCRECRYRSSCPTQQAPPEADEPDMDEDAFAEEMDHWLYADEQIRELRRFEKIRDGHRDEMVKMMSANNVNEVYVHDNTGQVRVAKLGTQKRNSPNYKRLQEALTPALYNELVPQNESKRFTVTKPK